MAEKRRRENDEIEEKRLALLEMERKLEEKQQMMAKQMEEFKMMMMMKQQPNPNIQLTRPSLTDSLNSSSSSEIRSADNSSKKISMDDTSGLMNANPTGLMARKAVTPNQHQRLPSSQPSPTMNTKEALAVMQQLWSTGAEQEDDSVFSDNNPQECIKFLPLPLGNIGNNFNPLCTAPFY